MFTKSMKVVILHKAAKAYEYHKSLINITLYLEYRSSTLFVRRVALQEQI
jgi:hypothetical protein